jgi:hypothetical protein
MVNPKSISCLLVKSLLLYFRNKGIKNLERNRATDVGMVFAKGVFRVILPQQMQRVGFPAYPLPTRGHLRQTSLVAPYTGMLDGHPLQGQPTGSRTPRFSPRNGSEEITRLAIRHRICDGDAKKSPREVVAVW